MANSRSSELAEWVASNNATNNLQRGVPEPPKPGELIVCQMCGQTMKPEDFSKDKKIRKYEFKWHIHWRCHQAIFNQLDAWDGREVDVNRSMDECETQASIQARSQIQQHIGE